MGKLRTVDVQRGFDRMSRRVVRGGRLISPASLHRIRAALRSALSEAQRQGMIGYNPAWRTRLPTGARVLPVVWTEERVRAWQELGIRPRVAVWDLPYLARFLEAVRCDPLFPLLWLAALRGLRRGELAGLRWEDVDLAGGVLHVREKVVRPRWAGALRAAEVAGGRTGPGTGGVHGAATGWGWRGRWRLPVCW